MDAREAAGSAVHEALPARWHVGPVSFDPGRHAWSVTAHGPLPGRGKAPQVVTGTGPDEVAALRTWTTACAASLGPTAAGWRS